MVLEIIEVQVPNGFNRVFHCSKPGFQDIVADATIRDRFLKTRWDLVPQLSQETI